MSVLLQDIQIAQSEIWRKNPNDLTLRVDAAKCFNLLKDRQTASFPVDLNTIGLHQKFSVYTNKAECEDRTTTNCAAPLCLDDIENQAVCLKDEFEGDTPTEEDVKAVLQYQLPTEPGLGHCDLSDNCADTDCSEYKFNFGLGTDFCIKEFDDEAGHAIRAKEQMGYKLAKSLSDMDRKLAELFIASIYASRGNNLHPNSLGQVVGGVANWTEYDGSLWEPGLMGHLGQAGDYSHLVDPFYLHGDNFGNAAYAAQFASAGCCEDKRLNAQISADQHAFCPKIFNKLGISNVTLQIDPNSYILGTRNVYAGFSPTNPKRNGGGELGERFSIASNNLNGVSYDVIYRTECCENIAKEGELCRAGVKHSWNIKVAGIFANQPTGCFDVSGVLAHVCR